MCPQLAHHDTQAALRKLLFDVQLQHNPPCPGATPHNRHALANLNTTILTNITNRPIDHMDTQSAYCRTGHPSAIHVDHNAPGDASPVGLGGSTILLLLPGLSNETHNNAAFKGRRQSCRQLRKLINQLR